MTYSRIICGLLALLVGAVGGNGLSGTAHDVIFGSDTLRTTVGAESRRPLGLAVVGGVFFSTFLTLVLVPVLYALFARFTEKANIENDEWIEDKSEHPMLEQERGSEVPEKTPA